jgi:HEAT repeat protein
MALGAANRLGLLDADQLAPFFDDPSVEVRYRAVELAPALATNPVAAPLIDRLLHALDDDALAEVAAFALGELALSAEDRARVAEALSNQAGHHDDALAREAAVAALGSLELGLDAILAATDDIATVRRRAVLALAPFDGPLVEAALSRALADRDWQVRQAAEDLGAVPDPA